MFTCDKTNGLTLNNRLRLTKQTAVVTKQNKQSYSE